MSLVRAPAVTPCQVVLAVDALTFLPVTLLGHALLGCASTLQPPLPASQPAR